MDRFFVEKKDINEEKIQIIGEDAKHISKVLRLREGDKIEVCDKECSEYIAQIFSIDKECTRAKIIEKLDVNTLTPIEAMNVLFKLKTLL